MSMEADQEQIKPLKPIRIMANEAINSKFVAKCNRGESGYMDKTDRNRLIDGQYAIHNKNAEISVYGVVKRTFDILFSLMLLIVLLPVFLIILLLIVVFGGNGSVIYSHERIGLHGVPFEMYKFRSMREGVNLEDVVSEEELENYYKEYKLQNDPRITGIGRILRKTSLDELPQLFNILKGNMSFIGPRPVTFEETLFYGESRDELLSVKPGLTGYWQAYARNSVSYGNGKRQEMELYYVRNRSIWLDVKIFFKTFETVLLRKNVF